MNVDKQDLAGFLEDEPLIDPILSSKSICGDSHRELQPTSLGVGLSTAGEVYTEKGMKVKQILAGKLRSFQQLPDVFYSK